MKEFGVSRTIAILPVSLFLMGLGTGPLIIGPLSEVYGASCDIHSTEELIFFLRSESCILWVVHRFLHLLLGGSVCPQRRCVLSPSQ